MGNVMRFWKRRAEQPAGEQRAGYTDAIIQELQRRAQTLSADPERTAAVQAAGGLWGRCLAVASVSPAATITRVVTPSVLYATGRDLCLRGQALWWFTTDSTMAPRLWHVGEFDITGDYDPATWRYRATIEGPTKRLVRTLTADEVVHVRIGEDAAAPWRGVSPLAAATDTAGTLAGVESGLRQEANQVSGYVLPGPTEGLDDSAFAELKADLQKLAGGTRIVPTLNPRPGDPSARPGDADWQAKRLGIHPPEALVDLRSAAALDVLAAAGVPPALGSHSTDATGLREGLRQFFHTTLQPVVRIVETELTRVLEVDVALDLSSLAAADVQGRARAYRAMVGNGNGPGIPDDQARRLTGLD